MSLVSIYSTLQKRIEASKGLTEYERKAWLFFKTYQNQLTRWQAQVRSDATWQNVSQGESSKQLVNPTSAFPGKIYFFLYNPKGRETLPYYDRFPFVLVLDKGPDWFLGLNFHYLNYESRARLFDALHEYTINGKTSLAAQIKVTYQILQMTTRSAVAHLYKPCIKKYLTKQIKTPLLQVGSDYWHLALFLPVEQFANKTKGYVWRESEGQDFDGTE